MLHLIDWSVSVEDTKSIEICFMLGLILQFPFIDGLSYQLKLHVFLFLEKIFLAKVASRR